jgi:maltooligosyltrehalose trehalohydrolase
MHTFEVWAPLARTLAVQIGGKSYPMHQTERGWWKASVEEAHAGTKYGFSVDSGDPLPDPRSFYQPDGVHGLSQIIDHSTFEWTDKNWQPRPLASAIIYELHIGTFTPEGTFLSAIERLDYLADLGITHIEIMPVNEFSGPWGWGYDGVDLYAPHHKYGTPDDLKKLVNACHAKGLAVLLDVVYNHFGPAGNYLGKYGPYLTDKHKTPWGDAVNLDGKGSHEVRKFFTHNALMWLRDYHFDGLRLDAVHAFVDQSATHLLEQFASEVDTLSAKTGKHYVLIAESELNDPRLVTSREANGYGLDAQWADDLHHAIHTVITGELKGYYEDYGKLEHLAKGLKTPYIYEGDCYSIHRERYHGRPPIGLNGQHFVVCIQNHDQVGNRANGERLGHLVGANGQKIAAALLFAAPYVPMLFQGEEFAASAPFQYFSQHEDPELGRLVSEGRRNEFKAFGWKPEDVPDPQARETFERSKLNWDEVDKEPHAGMLQWYKNLIKLRRSSGLTDGHRDRIHVEFDEEAKWLTMRRGEFEIAVNFAGDRQAVPISHDPQNVMCSEQGFDVRPGLIELPAQSVAILMPQSFTELQTSRSAPDRMSRLASVGSA